jgi:hypothetical protein
MSWLGLVLLVLGAWLAFKVIGALLKLLMLVVALVGAYWFLAPQLGWPTVSELFYVLGPDFGNRRIEEVLQPSDMAGELGGRVVDGVVERIWSPPPEPPASVAPTHGVEPLPEPSHPDSAPLESGG